MGSDRKIEIDSSCGAPRARAGEEFARAGRECISQGVNKSTGGLLLFSVFLGAAGLVCKLLFEGEFYFLSGVLARDEVVRLRGLRFFCLRIESVERE